MERQPEPELMDLPEVAVAYANADFSAVNDAFVAKLLGMLGAAQGMRLLDLGTGPGDIPLRIARSRPDWHITAVDGSPAMLALARATLGIEGLSDLVSFVLGDAKFLSLTSSSFDAVISNSLLHHLADPLLFWREVARVGKPRAYVFIRDLFRPATPELARELVSRHAGTESTILQDEFYRSLLAAYTLTEVKTQLAVVDMSYLRVEQVSDRHIDVYGKLPV